ncbi:hypothetical protein SAMN04488068_2898 [Hydrocarboniphaga daqingensis]|uniref:Uncharacterized protein n=1 Tax=Hydrocarboniphaga daqingensis TaxID=490188 RepID=A0A1M5R518_9GAMM|nr:hypothetical protein [Hydrocarboniphaga daqingensis]SHH21311.1 hypothetical protein SAMN04488068_2898 [Hydrocarboniphaga daqingensis]
MKRSDGVTLTVAGVALVTATVLAPNYQSLERKRYTDRRDCECDYSAAQCQSAGGTEVVGPWFASDETIRRQDPADPGPGHCDRHWRSSSGYSGGRGEHGSVTTEPGYRNGFGGTARRGTPPRS